MKKMTIGLSFAAIAALAGGVAIAMPGTGKMGDTNNDGAISRTEMQANANERFTRMDANKDGKIDKADRDAMQAKRSAEMFAMIDKDSNGQISRQEFDAMHSARGDMDGKDGRRGGRHGGGHGGGDGHGGGMMMRSADANNDGAITRAEFDTATAARFAKMDANNDGSVSQAERDAARQQMREQWQQKRAQANQGS